MYVTHKRPDQCSFQYWTEVSGKCSVHISTVSLVEDRLCGLVVRVPGCRTEMCFLWGTNWIYICYVEESRPPLWSSGQSSWQRIQRSGFDFRRYQIFWEVVGLERGPLNLVSTTEEQLDRKSSGSGLENRDYGRRGSAALTTRHPSIRKSWH
jgi:hypothetical protein